MAVSPMELPDSARLRINNDLHLRMAIDEIEQLARDCESDGVLKLQPPDAQDLVVFMNSQQQNLNGHLERLYWGVATVAERSRGAGTDDSHRDKPYNFAGRRGRRPCSTCSTGAGS
jgi:hypothetical protein